MKEHPILLNGEMVKAVLDGRKTQTRRMVKCLIWTDPDSNPNTAAPFRYGHVATTKPCPYGAPGDRLWVRETLVRLSETESFSMPETGKTIDGVEYGANSATLYYWAYAADRDYCEDYTSEWEDKNKDKYIIPSIHMPRWASRITLEVVSVRVERVQEITNADAVAEGIVPLSTTWKNYLWHGDFGQYGDGNKQSDSWPHQYSDYEHPRDSFSSLWELIYAKRGYGWDMNPWVWAIEFKLITAAGRERRGAKQTKGEQ